MSGLRILRFDLVCTDPHATAEFYAAAFGAEIAGRMDGISVVLGTERIAFHAARTPRAVVARPSNETTFQHFAIVASDMALAMGRLQGVGGWSAISRAGPERLPANTGGVTAFKFRDPDGHPLEFLSFPPGGVPAPWVGKSGPCLGIDHTAITVRDTARSVAFYEGCGFTVGSRSLNQGLEQSRLDDVDDAVVEVTGLMPPGGAPPHLELLCYRSPVGGPVRLDRDDVLATRTVLARSIEGGGSRPDEDPPLAYDPDGHAVAFR